MAGLGDADPRYQKGANYFPPMTAEQQAQLDRDKINESLGPFDFAPGMGTAIGTGAVAGLIPYAAYAATRLGAADTAKMLGALGVIGPGAGYAKDILARYFDRSDREKAMMMGNPADAEGQPGGFYGQFPRR